MRTLLSEYGCEVDPDMRVLYTPHGRYTFAPYMTRTACRALMRRHLGLIMTTRQIVHDAQAQRMQGVLDL